MLEENMYMHICCTCGVQFVRKGKRNFTCIECMEKELIESHKKVKELEKENEQLKEDANLGRF